jgi:hypothetical protein
MHNINQLIAEGNLSDAASILYDSFYTILTSGSPRVNISRAEFDKVAPELVKKLQNPDKADPGVDIIDKANTAPLIINFVGPAGICIPKDIKKKIIIGLKYKYAAPVIKGLIAVPESVEGTMTENGVETTIVYGVDPTIPAKVSAHKLLIEYKTPEGVVCPDGYVAMLNEGEEFMIISPTIEGCTPDKKDVNGVMETKDIKVLVTYTKDAVEKHTLVITYAGPEDKHFIIPDGVIEELEVGKTYNVKSPVLDGYAADKTVVSGTMGKKDIDVLVTYEAVDKKEDK